MVQPEVAGGKWERGLGMERSGNGCSLDINTFCLLVGCAEVAVVTEVLELGEQIGLFPSRKIIRTGTRR